jgi:hypothetical protein
MCECSGGVFWCDSNPHLRKLLAITSINWYFLKCYSSLPYRVLKNVLPVLRGYDTHLNEQQNRSQRIFRTQCLLRYGRVCVCVGIIGDHFLGPAVSPNKETRAGYHHFLVNTLQVLLEPVPIQQQRMWFMHGGAPPHLPNTVRQHLNQTCGEQWLGRGGPVN